MAFNNTGSLAVLLLAVLALCTSVAADGCSEYDNDCLGCANDSSCYFRAGRGCTTDYSGEPATSGTYESDWSRSSDCNAVSSSYCYKECTYEGIATQGTSSTSTTFGAYTREFYTTHIPMSIDGIEFDNYDEETYHTILPEVTGNYTAVTAVVGGDGAGFTISTGTFDRSDDQDVRGDENSVTVKITAVGTVSAASFPAGDAYDGTSTISNILTVASTDVNLGWTVSGYDTVKVKSGQDSSMDITCETEEGFAATVERYTTLNCKINLAYLASSGSVDFPLFQLEVTDTGSVDGAFTVDVASTAVEETVTADSAAIITGPTDSAAGTTYYKVETNESSIVDLTITLNYLPDTPDAIVDPTAPVESADSESSASALLGSFAMVAGLLLVLA